MMQQDTGYTVTQRTPSLLGSPMAGSSTKCKLGSRELKNLTFYVQWRQHMSLPFVISDSTNVNT
jgi:hypothetical protein